MTLAARIQTDPFINRIDELKIIEEEKIEALSQGASLFQFITTIAGIPGIGKTTLLEKVANTSDSLSMRYMLVSLGKNFAEKKDDFYLFKLIAEKCFEKEANRKVQKDVISIPQMGEDSLRIFLNHYSEHFLKYLKENPLILLIDDSHRLNETERKVLEGIMERVCGLNRLLLILAGRSDIRWRSFELRRRTYRISLTHFDKEQTGRLLLTPKDEQLTSKIYQLTRGYPLASVQALEWVGNNLSVTAPEFHQQLTERETDLVLSLTDTILNQFILIDIPDSGNRNFLEVLLKNTSPLRRFDNDILSGLLNKLNTNDDEVDPVESMRYIREMAALTHLVTWKSQKMGYSTDIAVRKLLALSMKYRNKETYLTIHEHMASFYRNEMKTAMDKDPSSPQSILHLMEFIFHTVSFRFAKNEIKQCIDEIESSVANNLKKYKVREKNHFYEEFKNDEELNEILGEQYRKILELVESHL